MKNKWLSGISYRLGEKQCNFKELPNHKEILSGCNLPNLPAMLGLESYYKTDDVYALLSDSVAQTLSNTEISATSIDCVIFSSSKFNDGFDVQNKRFAQILAGHAISPKSIYCVSGTGCVGLFSALELASSLIDSGTATNILVVNIESFGSLLDQDRFIAYAMISDCAASVILSGNKTGNKNIEVIGHQKRTDVPQMLDGINIENNGRNISFVKSILETWGVDSKDIKKIFANNILAPLKMVKERSFGFSSEQLFSANVPRIAHCLGADALINLADYLEQTPTERGVSLLYGEADGHAASLLIRIDG